MCPQQDGNSPTVICLTPVKNEETNIENFLRAASLWANHIVVADQGSSDRTRDIARSFEKVTLIQNEDPEYNEIGRQRLLLEAARSIPGRRILLALDADEALTADWSESKGWAQLLEAPAGTAIRFPWINLLPGAERAWVPPVPVRFGYIDDGAPHDGNVIHQTRLPAGSGPPLDMDDLGVLHLQYLDWPTMKSKQRWYQAFERVKFPDKRPAHIYRQYHHMDAMSADEVMSVPAPWLRRYSDEGIRLTSSVGPSPSHFDAQVLDLLEEYGAGHFRRIDIWDVDWDSTARLLDRTTRIGSDPRRALDRLILKYLAWTQRQQESMPVRLGVRALNIFGW